LGKGDDSSVAKGQDAIIGDPRPPQSIWIKFLPSRDAVIFQ
jgi:hypothetical protein